MTDQTEKKAGSRPAGWLDQLALRTIECLSETGDKVDAIHRILRVIVEGTGIQYAGIRIKEDKDYPFYVFRGFSQEFIQQENSLCRRNPDGTLAFDAQGRAELACVCGRVLRGQTNPQHDFFTPGGSFFSPTLQSLAVTVGPETLGSTRGRCIADGFETHALIPLRHDNETIGLLHLSDSRPQFLSGADVAFFERLGTIVGVALAYKQTKQRQILTDDTYRSLFEKLGWGYALHEVLFDQDGIPTDYVTLDVNHAFEEFLNAPRAAVVGKPASAILPGPELASWIALFGDVARGGPPTTYETYSPHNQKHFRGHAFSLKRGGFSVAFEDVTERKKSQAQLLQAQKMESIGVLAGGIAHDFNNILGTILGGVELAMMKVDKLDRTQGDGIRLELDSVQRAARRASALVKQILSFSRRNQEEKQPHALRRIVREACKFLRSALPSTIEIQEKISTDGPVLANPNQIHQVVMNLLTNAGLAMPGGGRIELGLDLCDLDGAFCAGHPGLAAGRFVRLLVRDMGCGIAPENLGRIFEPFFTTRPEGMGTGLGLSVVHGIVADHGGVVTVASEVGKGTTFQVYLPLHEHPLASAACEEKALPGKERILFVDDEEDLVQMAKRGLADLGYWVAAFVSSVEALRAFRAAPDFYDAVVSDITMPGLTGDALARELRGIRPDIPIVLLTGSGEHMAREKAAAAGIQTFLLKPYSLAGLSVCLRKILDQIPKSSR